MTRRRHLQGIIEELAFTSDKMAFVSGPRQVGKTTLGRAWIKRRGAGAYANWDDIETRRKWAKDPKTFVPDPTTKGEKPLLVLDEIHKAKSWKRSVKGMYDTLEAPVDIMVTGSARLNVYKKGSDSLLGRYLHFRLHPFSVRELGWPSTGPVNELLASLEARSQSPRASAQEALEGLLKFGGFPEPFLAQDDRRARLWRRGRVEKVVREDLRDLSRIPELSRVEMLAALLPERVGSMFSVAAVREDLEVAHDTVSRWLGYLRELYYVFEVKPYNRSIRRSLRKEGKLYMWDWSEVDAEPARFENLVASHLAKACDTWTDSGEGSFELYLVRDKEKRELDFLIVRDRKPWLPVEVKPRDTTPSTAFRAFLPQLGCRLGLQLVREPRAWSVHEVAGLPGARVIVASAADVLGYLA